MPIKSKISVLAIAGCILVFGVELLGSAEAKDRRSQCRHPDLSNSQICRKQIAKTKAPAKKGIGADAALTILELLF